MVRVSRDDAGAIRGVVVRVSTGERRGFASQNSLGPFLSELVEADRRETDRDRLETYGGIFTHSQEGVVR